MKTLCVVTIALVLAAAVYAQAALTGKWEESSTSGLHAQLDMTATKTTVAGTFTIKGRPMTIMDGKVSKNTFTFKAKLDDQPEGFTGELAGDEITLSRDKNGPSDAVTLKRVKK
jgi:opacity protein-like surface antigen